MERKEFCVWNQRASVGLVVDHNHCTSIVQYLDEVRATYFPPSRATPGGLGSNDVISCSRLVLLYGVPPFISLRCLRTYLPVKGLTIHSLCTLSHTYNHTTIIRTMMAQIIIIIDVVQLPPFHAFHPYYHCNVQGFTQPPFLFTTYKYQSTSCYCLHTDRGSDPTQLVFSSAQPGNRQHKCCIL
jgi:hypothetical protein